MRAKIVQALVVVPLALACWLLMILWWGSGNARPWPMLLIVVEIALVIWLSAWALSTATRRLSARVWLFSGLLVLAGLALPVYTGGQDLQGRLPAILAALLTWYPSLITAVALVVAALLLASGLRLHGAWRQADPPAGLSRRGRLPGAAAMCLVLSALVLGQMLNRLYWLTVWDTTYDPLGYLWIALPVLAAVFSALLLWNTLAGRVRWAAVVYGLLIPALMIAVSAQGQRVDFRQLTLARAERTRLAIEAFHAREGRYPQSLDALSPWYVVSVPGPIIMAGQDWCYDRGDNYYRLGYVYRAHWSDPRLEGRLYAAQGEAPDQPGVCAAEITALRQSDPGYYGVVGN